MVTKDETSETIPRNLFSPFFAFRVPGSLKLTYFVLNLLVNHQNSSFFKFWVVFTVLLFVGNPVY